MVAMAVFVGVDLVVLVTSAAIGIALFARFHRRDREAKLIAAAIARAQAARAARGTEDGATS